MKQCKVYITGINHSQFPYKIHKKQKCTSSEKQIWYTHYSLSIPYYMYYTLTGLEQTTYRQSEILLICRIWPSDDHNSTKRMLLKSHQIIQAMMSHTSKLPTWKKLKSDARFLSKWLTWKFYLGYTVSITTFYIGLLHKIYMLFLFKYISIF